jgi:hypothetical protein
MDALLMPCRSNMADMSRATCGQTLVKHVWSKCDRQVNLLLYACLQVPGKDTQHVAGFVLSITPASCVFRTKSDMLQTSGAVGMWSVQRMLMCLYSKANTGLPRAVVRSRKGM